MAKKRKGRPVKFTKKKMRSFLKTLANNFGQIDITCAEEKVSVSGVTHTRNLPKNAWFDQEVKKIQMKEDAKHDKKLYKENKIFRLNLSKKINDPKSKLTAKDRLDGAKFLHEYLEKKQKRRDVKEEITKNSDGTSSKTVKYRKPKGVK